MIAGNCSKLSPSKSDIIVVTQQCDSDIFKINERTIDRTKAIGLMFWK